jgi:cardiolipin synthase
MDDLIEIGAHSDASGKTLSRHEMHVPRELPPGPEGLGFALYQVTRTPLRPGNRAALVENGRVFDVMVEEIRKAQRSVHILVFIWRPCEASDRLVEALSERARAGVKCRIVVDPLGSNQVFGRRDFDEHVEPRLTEAGCEVHYYRLLTGRIRERLLERDHQKLVIVDGRVGIAGGFGIWKTWEGDGVGEEHWRDTHLRIEGPVVHDLQLSFARSWQGSGGALLPHEELAPIPEVGPVHAGYVTSHGEMGVTDAERMYCLVFAAARERLWIANAYFSPPDRMLALLCDKRRGGVDVRVLASGPITDQKVMRASQRSTYERLLRAGIRVFEYQPSLMHAKTVVVDDWLSVVGSINMDPLSLNKLGEGSLVLSDPALNASLAESYERDLGRAREITLPGGGRTSPWRRLARQMTLHLGKER